jgi:ApaG protein
MPHHATYWPCDYIDLAPITDRDDVKSLSRRCRRVPHPVHDKMCQAGGANQKPGKPVSIARSFQSAIAMTVTSPHKIRVDVSTNYVGEQSKPDESHYVFAYTITIRNEGKVPARLLTRHWVITNGNGKVKEVRGEGVVGEQPVLGPGERFEYTSGVPLSTASGFMTGRYLMVSETGERFEIDLLPGQGFRYSSGAVLETPVGFMQGSYQMLADDGAHFDVPIAPFTLAMPGLLH